MKRDSNHPGGYSDEIANPRDIPATAEEAANVAIPDLTELAIDGEADNPRLETARVLLACVITLGQCLRRDIRATMSLLRPIAHAVRTKQPIVVETVLAHLSGRQIPGALEVGQRMGISKQAAHQARKKGLCALAEYDPALVDAISARITDEAQDAREGSVGVDLDPAMTVVREPLPANARMTGAHKFSVGSRRVDAVASNRRSDGRLIITLESGEVVEGPLVYCYEVADCGKVGSAWVEKASTKT